MYIKNKKFVITITAILALLIAIFFIFINPNNEAIKNKLLSSWTYHGKNGPDHWSSLSKEYKLCSEGLSQSPINLITQDAIPAQANAFQYRYQDTALAIAKKDHTIEVSYRADSYVKIGARNYKLLQFHFHTPSEYTVDGVAYPMTLDLVHRDSKGHLAIINVFITEGEANPTIDKLLENIPTKRNKLVTLENVQINALDLLPENGSYYQMSGSLTIPPCSENVAWNLLTTPITLSKAQIDKFTSIIGTNARPIQPLNDRNIVLINTGKIVK